MVQHLPLQVVPKLQQSQLLSQRQATLKMLVAWAAGAVGLLLVLILVGQVKACQTIQQRLQRLMAPLPRPADYH